MVCKLKEEAMKGNRPADAVVKTEDIPLNGIACSHCNELTDRKKLYLCTDPSHAEGKQQASSSSTSVEAYWNVDEVAII